MSSGRMDQGPGDQTPDELLARYEQASALDDARPGARVRVAVLAHARAVAQAPRQREASNSPSWRMQALGSLAVIGLVGMLYMQFDRGSDQEREAVFGAGSRSAAPPVAVAAPAVAVDAAPAGKEAATTPSTSPVSTATAPSTAVAAPFRAGGPARSAAASPAATPSAKRDKTQALAQEQGQVQRQTQAQDAAEPAAEFAKASATQRQEALAAAVPAIAAPTPALAAPVPALAPAPARARGPAPATEAGADRSGSGALASRRFAANAAGLAQALRQAALVGDLAGIEALITQGAALESVDEAGRTPLLLAVMQGQRAAVARLLAAGANAQAQDREGATALRHAQGRAFAEIEVLLRQHGAH